MASKQVTPPQKPKELSIGKNILYSAVGGVCGAAAVFPLDFAKTRLQMDHSGQYKNLIDCFQKLKAAHGFGGLYRGLVPNLIGIMPEKTIKLYFNDAFRQFFKVDDKRVYPHGHILLEGLSGGLAGFFQVIVTTPMELTKIRMQMHTPTPGQSVSQLQSLKGIVSELGIRGMYKGTASTLLRDVPFSVIYFGLYGILRRKIADPETNKVSAFGALTCSTLAGVVGSSLATPMDVLKTRLQSTPVAGQEPYKGVLSTFNRIVATEGYGALWKGLIPRVAIISPLFGIALMVKETLAKWWP